MNQLKKHWRWIALLSAVLVFFYIAAGFFAQPSTDDFSWAFKDNVWQHVLSEYLHWCGRYTGILAAIPFLSFLPMHKVYFLYIVPELLLLFGAILFFTRQLLERIAPQRSRLDLIGIAGLLFVLCLQTAPHVAQSYYWIVGIVMYGIPVILFFLYLGLLLKKFSRRWLGIVMVALTSFLMVGTSEPAALVYTGMNVFIFFFFWIKRSLPRDLAQKLIAGFIAGCCGFLAVFLAPGNTTRIATGDPAELWNVGYSLLEGGKSTVAFFIKRNFLLPPLFFAVLIALFLVVVILLRKKIIKAPKLLTDFWAGALALVFIIGSVYATQFIALMSTNMQVPFRTQSFLTALMLVAESIVVVNLAVMSERRVTVDPERALAWTARYIFIVLFVIFGYFLINVPGYVAFYRENQVRWQQVERIADKEHTDVVCKPFSVKPWPIFNKDIKESKDYFTNIVAARYFGVRSISVK